MPHSRLLAAEKKIGRFLRCPIFQKAGCRSGGGIFMTRAELAKQAFDECCSSETTVRYGTRRGAPFWNAESTMFMYVPAFHFTSVRGCRRYLYRAVDENGKQHTFEAEHCCALLTPIWAELPEGVVRLTVTALEEDGSEYGLVGARVFFKSASFPEKHRRRFAPMPNVLCAHTDLPCRRALSDIGSITECPILPMT